MAPVLLKDFLPPSDFLTIRRHLRLHGSFDVEDSKHVCSNMYDPCSLMSKRFSKNLLCEQHQVCYGVSFLEESKLERYLAKSQPIQVLTLLEETNQAITTYLVE